MLTRIYTIGSEMTLPLPFQKTGGPKHRNLNKHFKFLRTSHLDREYLRNEPRRTENGVANCNLRPEPQEELTALF